VYEGLRAVNYSWFFFSTKLLSEIDVVVDAENAFKRCRIRLKQLKRMHGSVVWAYLDSVGFALDYLLKHSVSPEQTAFALDALRSQMTSGGRGLLFYYLLCSEERCQYLPFLMAAYYFDDLAEDPLAERRQDLFVAASELYQLKTVSVSEFS
jgi:hypothetical protein